jgi:UDP:flavonoid glycosyltransferase YjiC (YdhE family)
MVRTEPISMPRVLLLSSPIGGHVAPMLSAAAGLIARGHEVVFLTGARFADAVAATGAEHVALPPEADYDDRDLDASFPQRRALKGMAQLKSDLINTFIDPLPHQYRAVCELLDTREIDVIVSEAAAIGAVPLVLGARATRPPIVSCGVVPLTLSSRDTAPYGPALPPMAGPLGRLRNRALRFGVEKVAFRSVQQHANTLLEQVGARPLPVFCFDAIGVLPDRFLQFSVPGFEYPRSDLPATVRFAGRVAPRTGDVALPEWWDELDGERPVVHVTQGTLDNANLDRVIGPTLRALAGEDVLVVASTGWAPRPGAARPDPRQRQGGGVPALRRAAAQGRRDGHQRRLRRRAAGARRRHPARGGWRRGGQARDRGAGRLERRRGEPQDR